MESTNRRLRDVNRRFRILIRRFERANRRFAPTKRVLTQTINTEQLRVFGMPFPAVHKMQDGEIHGHGAAHCQHRCHKATRAEEREKIEESYLQGVVHDVAKAEACRLPYRCPAAESEISGEIEVAYNAHDVAHGHADVQPKMPAEHELHQKIYRVLDCGGNKPHNHKTQYLSLYLSV